MTVGPTRGRQNRTALGLRREPESVSTRQRKPSSQARASHRAWVEKKRVRGISGCRSAEQRFCSREEQWSAAGAANVSTEHRAGTATAAVTVVLVCVCVLFLRMRFLDRRGSGWVRCVWVLYGWRGRGGGLVQSRLPQPRVALLLASARSSSAFQRRHLAVPDANVAAVRASLPPSSHQQVGLRESDRAGGCRADWPGPSWGPAPDWTTMTTRTRDEARTSKGTKRRAGCREANERTTATAVVFGGLAAGDHPLGPDPGR
jgi:hypothetical protein